MKKKELLKTVTVLTLLTGGFGAASLYPSTVTYAESVNDETPAPDEEIPDAAQLALIKKIDGILNEIAANITSDPEEARAILDEESRTLSAISGVENTAERERLQARLADLRAQLNGQAEPKIESKEEMRPKVIPFETETLEDPQLEKGSRLVITKGVDGLINLYELVTYQDGREIKRELKSSKVITEMVKEIVRIGTKVTPTVDPKDQDKPADGKDEVKPAEEKTAETKPSTDKPGNNQPGNNQADHTKPADQSSDNQNKNEADSSKLTDPKEGTQSSQESDTGDKQLPKTGERETVIAMSVGIIILACVSLATFLTYYFRRKDREDEHDR